MEEDQCIEKVSISGPALASMIQRFSTSRGSLDGLIFGHVTHIAPTLTDDSSASSSSSTLIATITSFFCSSSSLSFYSPSGRVDPLTLRRFSQAQAQPQSQSHLLGWFSGRRRTHLRPSLRELAVSASLIQNPKGPTTPSLFLLFASPISDQTIIHTHEYRAYQLLRGPAHFFEPKSIDVVNLGPAFRAHYGAFNPTSQFPALPCEMRVSPMNVDKGEAEEESLGQMKQGLKAQSELDMYAEGLEVSSLGRLMGPEAVRYSSGVEDLYEKMLLKIESLARQVEISSAKIREQEDHNRKLRYKAARTGGF